jgi:hypothetical protein
MRSSKQHGKQGFIKSEYELLGEMRIYRRMPRWVLPNGVAGDPLLFMEGPQ